MENEEMKTVQGWKDVNVTLDMPIGAFLSFINALNQRLAQIEDVTNVPYGNKMISLTELYAIQAAEAQRQAMERANKQPEGEPVDDQPVDDNPGDHQGA